MLSPFSMRLRHLSPTEKALSQRWSVQNLLMERLMYFEKSERLRVREKGAVILAAPLLPS